MAAARDRSRAVVRRPPGEEVEARLDPTGHLGEGEGVQSGRSQLDRQGQAVEAPAHIGHEGELVLVRAPGGPHGAGPVDEEADGRLVEAA